MDIPASLCMYQMHTYKKCNNGMLEHPLNFMKCTVTACGVKYMRLSEVTVDTRSLCLVPCWLDVQRGMSE